MTVPEKAVSQTWHYQGRRELQKGGLGDLWLDHEGERRLFKKFPGISIGSPHEVETLDESHVTGHARLLDGDRHPDADEWALLDRAAYTSDQQRKRESKARREGSSIGDLTLDELRRMLDHAGPQRAGMLAQILHHLGA